MGARNCHIDVVCNKQSEVDDDDGSQIIDATCSVRTGNLADRKGLWV